MLGAATGLGRRFEGSGARMTSLDPRHPLEDSVKRLASWTLLVLSLAPAVGAVDLGDGRVHLRHGSWSVAAGPPGVAGKATPADPGAWVVVFDPPASDALRGEIERAGGFIAGYVPSNAYLVRADAGESRAIRSVPGVRRVEGYRAEWKVAPELAVEARRSSLDPRLHVELWDDVEPAAVAERALGQGIEVLEVYAHPGIHRLVVRARPEDVATLAAFAEVEWIEAVGRFTLRNDNTRWIIQSNDGVGFATPLHARGLFGAGEIIGHIDESPYITSCFFADTLDNTPAPTHRKIVAHRGAGAGIHGTHTAGIAIGENYDLAFPQHRGQAPKARLSHSNLTALNGEFNELPSNLDSLLELAHADGARIHTNSFGDDALTSYTSWCVDIDAFSRQNEEDLVVFAASNLATLRTPENAKNCIAVGATFAAPSQDFRRNGGSGPTVDGRRKPDVYAPGHDVRSAAAGQLCATVLRGGTSMAAPAVAGGAALLREYFRRGFFPTGKPFAPNGFTPTGALLKAAVINSTVDMTGEPGYPSNAEGWGRILLDDVLYFDGDARALWLRDVRHAEGLSTGQLDEWRFRVLGSAQPLRITMAFMDQPASLGAAIASVNDLDLEVEGPTGLYRGNVIDTLVGTSTTGGTADALNDVERVLIASPAAGPWIVRVRGTSVPLGPQGYAVVANGALDRKDFRTAQAPAPPESEPELRRHAAELRITGPAPNPFRTSTALTFTITAEARVEIRVYDVAGRAVRHLVARGVEPGEHRVVWDGYDDEGRRARPGIYFVRLTAPGIERIAKTALLR